MPKCVGPGSYYGASPRSPRSPMGWRGYNPSPIPTLSRRLWPFSSPALGAQLLWPQCKILATPLGLGRSIEGSRDRASLWVGGGGFTMLLTSPSPARKLNTIRLPISNFACSFAYERYSK